MRGTGRSDVRRLTSDVLGIVAAVVLAVAVLPGTGRADPPASGVIQKEDVTFAIDIDPTTLAVGKQFTVKLTATFPEGTRLYFPEAPAVKPFLLVSHRHDAQAVAGVGTSESHQLTMLPVRVGTSVLAPMEVPYVTATGEARIAHTPEVRIQVGSTLGDEADPQPAPAGTPMPVRVRNTPLIWGLSSLGVALAAALMGILAYRRWRAWRDAHRPPPPPRPAHEVALERLAQIEAMGLVDAGDFKQLALLVTEVVREFLGGRFGFSGVDLTTWEVLGLLAGRDLGRMTTVELEDYLGFCDLVKFAKFQPTADEGRGLLRRAYEVVGRVMEGRDPGSAGIEAIPVGPSAVPSGGANWDDGSGWGGGGEP